MTSGQLGLHDLKSILIFQTCSTSSSDDLCLIKPMDEECVSINGCVSINVCLSINVCVSINVCIDQCVFVDQYVCVPV